MLNDEELGRLDAHFKGLFFAPAQGGAGGESSQSSQESSQSSQLQDGQVPCLRRVMGKRKRHDHVHTLATDGLVKRAKQEVLAALEAGTWAERKAAGLQWLPNFAEETVKTVSEDLEVVRGCQGVLETLDSFLSGPAMGVDVQERARALGLGKLLEAVDKPPKVMMCALSLLLSPNKCTHTHTHAGTHTHKQTKVRLMSRVQGFEEAFSLQAMEKVKSSDAACADEALILMARVLVDLDEDSASGEGELDYENVAEEVLRTTIEAVAKDRHWGAVHFARSMDHPDKSRVASKVQQEVALQLALEALYQWLGGYSGLVCKPPSRAPAGVDEAAEFCKDATNLISQACNTVFPCRPSSGGGEQPHNPNFGANTQAGLKPRLELLCLTRVRAHACQRSVRVRARACACQCRPVKP